MARRHDHDAGGDAEVLAHKRALREATWDRMVAAGVGRFPAPHNRIPNFVGAEAAAELLRSQPAWQSAATVKSNPDSPQWPVRQRALEDGKVVYMAVPRLAEDDPFFLLDPHDLADTPRKASSIKGATRSARTVTVAELEPVDLVVTGCVAVDRSGARLGKGGGFSDLEYALAWEAGLIGPDTVVVTTVHDVQVLPEGDIPVTDHDFRLDLVVTPDDVIECSPGERTPAAIRWDELTDDKIRSISLLARLAAEQ
ncbi:5-formyltetrahydrofolate cyclo-ligase [Acidimicrobiia bacterium EGI L10123]|uniref:5-formyltetrahydrofolate cyclo-ligase n=1 Tax=Salinilacustrithrix flava TaxID=2957203 RepID=UPI003D7C2D90|nr:5-formyltetrahydrofolate cyclo-ligase [Acidimicrobiia bacterium EGI L10123]